jgi:GT2 family glycosyltransferase
VIVVNYNGRRWLERCLTAADQAGRAALAQGRVGEVEILLVDNGSTDGSADLIRELFPAVRLLALDENFGFTGGNNRGAAAARGEWLAFLNNDTEADEQWLAALTRTLASDPAIGLVTSRIVYMDDPGVIDSAGDGYLRAGGAFKRGHGQPAAAWDEPGSVFGACGAACVIRRPLFDALGGFDPAFFMAFEDVDLSYGVQLLGHDCRYVPDAIVHHAGSASLGRLSERAVFYGQRNLEWVYVKNTPWPLLLRSLPSHLLYVTAAAFYFARAGAFLPFVRSKWAALIGLPGMLRQRRARQRLRVAPSRRIWARMEPGWLSLKLREKRFDLQAAGR